MQAGDSINKLAPEFCLIPFWFTVALEAVPLEQNQYIRILDTRTGVVRVERGESSVYLEPTENFIEKIQDGINVDEHTAVVVRNIESGQLKLVDTPQVFMPAADQQIAQVSKRICLEDHETVVVKDKFGGFTFRKGSDAERSFFLDPCECQPTSET